MNGNYDHIVGLDLAAVHVVRRALEFYRDSMVELAEGLDDIAAFPAIALEHVMEAHGVLSDIDLQLGGL